MDCRDQILLNDWHVVGDLTQLEHQCKISTFIFGMPIDVTIAADGTVRVISTKTGDDLPSQCKYGFVWTCVGQPDRDIITIPETLENDRYTVSGGSFAVDVSGLRVVENFLDMGHFPFVHTGWLGDEPHTEVVPYQVEVTPDDQIIATECYFYQPVASPTSEGGTIVEYVYQVHRPYLVSLQKANPVHPEKMDYIMLFIQPVGPEKCIAHPMLCYLKDGMTKANLRWFMQLIFAQDKPILVNQLPKRLPLDPRAETPIRADKVAIVYRRWLRDHAISYGAILPALSERENA